MTNSNLLPGIYLIFFLGFMLAGLYQEIWVEWYDVVGVLGWVFAMSGHLLWLSEVGEKKSGGVTRSDRVDA